MESDDVTVFTGQVNTYQDIDLTTQNILGLLKSIISGPGRPSGDLVEP